MGQAKKRREKLGDMYGRHNSKEELDLIALSKIQAFRGVVALAPTTYSADTLARLLSPADMLEAHRLITAGPASFYQSFKSVDSTISKVILWASGETCGVELVPTAVNHQSSL